MENKNTNATRTTEAETLLQIARRHLHLETLETRNSDRLDFSDQGVASLKAALEAAFNAGKAAGNAEARERLGRRH